MSIIYAHVNKVQMASPAHPCSETVGKKGAGPGPQEAPVQEQADHDGYLPSVVVITEGKRHDVR
jgi:hypothetical protein